MVRIHVLMFHHYRMIWFLRWNGRIVQSVPSENGSTNALKSPIESYSDSGMRGTKLNMKRCNGRCNQTINQASCCYCFRLILGFASKTVSEQLLQQRVEPIMMIRFSDSQLGCLIISYWIPGSGLEPQHLRVGGVELESVSLDNCIRHCNELKNINIVYPDQPKSKLWSSNEETVSSPNVPYGRRMFVSLNVTPLPAVEYEAPTPPANLNM